MISTDRVYIWNTAICERIEYRFDYCTLIARKIEDMTDDEVREIKGYPVHPDVCKIIREGWIKDARIQRMTGRMERNLADIGVYFLNNNHLETGEVIDIKTL